jgi:hypothetical protein
METGFWTGTKSIFIIQIHSRQIPTAMGYRMAMRFGNTAPTRTAGIRTTMDMSDLEEIQAGTDLLDPDSYPN